MHALFGRLVTDIAVYNGPGDDGAAVKERGLVPGHDSRGAQVSLTARQATADVWSAHTAAQVIHWTALRVRCQRLR